jgi:hypothetical protein
MMINERGTVGGMKIVGETKHSEKPLPAPQSRHLTWNRTRVAAVKKRRLTA